MKKVRLAAEASGDITEIFDYIAEDSVDAAQRVCPEIQEELKKLARSSPVIQVAATSGRT